MTGADPARASHASVRRRYRLVAMDTKRTLPWSIEEVDEQLVACSALSRRVSPSTRERLRCRIDHLLDRRTMLTNASREGVSTAPR